jgi:hypothetical protein
MFTRSVILALVVAACAPATPDAARDSVPAAPTPAPSAHADSSVTAPPAATVTQVDPASDSTAADSAFGNAFFDDSASISVCVEQRGDTSVYHYEVTNGPRALLRVFRIGFGTVRTHDVTDNPDGGGELDVEPAGMTGDDVRIRAPGAQSPHGWHAEWQRVEETSGHLVEWFADSNRFGIAPRETRGGYSIAVPGGDSAYATAHWSLLVDAPQDHSGRLRRVACR